MDLNESVDLEDFEDEGNELDDFFPKSLINNESIISSKPNKITKKTIVLKWIMIIQALTTALTLLSAAHIHWKISETANKSKIYCPKNTMEIVRTKRDLNKTLSKRLVAENLNKTFRKIDGDNGNNMWVHSLSKIQVIFKRI